MKCTLMMLMSVIVAACCGCHAGIRPTLDANGTVAYTDLEGGAWYVRTDDGQSLTGFVPESLRIAGRRVYVEYTVLEGVNSGLQFGTPVVFNVIEPGKSA